MSKANPFSRTGKRVAGSSLAGVLCALCAILSSDYARSQGLPPIGFSEFKHVRWGVEEGAPDVGQIVQTPDGYLWLSGSSLYRFDGLSFERIDWPVGASRPSLAPFGLMVSRRGDLWIGLRSSGGVVRYRDGHLEDMQLPDPPQATGYFIEEQSGAIWAGSGTMTKRLHRLRRGRWERMDEQLRLPEGAIMSMVNAPDGTIWIALAHPDGMTGELVYLTRGASRFRTWPLVLGARPTAALDPKGSLWITDGTGTRRVVDAKGRPAAPGRKFSVPERLRFARLAFDRGGGVWGTTVSSGIFRIADPAAGAPNPTDAFHTFDARDGLTSDISFSAFVDREGNVWIGTENGLDQFRPARAVQDRSIPADAADGLQMVRASDGSIYFMSQATIFRSESNEPARSIFTFPRALATICRARNGGVWVVEPSRVTRIIGNEIASSTKAILATGLYSCAEDRTGTLWGGNQQLVRFDGKSWRADSGLTSEEDVTELASTPSGDIYFISGTRLGAIRGRRGQFIDVVPENFGTLGMVTPEADEIWIGGSGGLLRLRDGHARLLSQRRFPWLAGTRGIVRTPGGQTWLMAQYEISRVSTAELDRAFDSEGAELPRLTFNAQDGLLSTSQHVGFWGAQMLLGEHGRIWLLNRVGAAHFDPPALVPNPVAPTVLIRSLSAAGKTYPTPSVVSLPAGTRSFEIAYAGLSLVVPERVKFKYRLDGVDDSWIDAGTRRSGIYANVGPGHYRFQVMAANSDGKWNTTGASVEIDIPPTFQQGWVFKLLIGLILAALLWLLYALRLRAVSSRIRSHMAERMMERERIARELHDTLLQSVQSLTLRFQLAVDELAKRHPARRGLEDAIDLADRVIAEGRDRVRDLRSLHDSDIGQIICDLIARQGLDASLDVQIKSTGQARPVDPVVLDELSQFASEAIFNIRKHAEAKRLEVQIGWDKDLRVRIADDGIGIAPDVLAAGGREGHFGLRGLQERVRRLDGQLVIDSSPGGGTRLDLTVPGRVAYAGDKRSRRWPFGSR